MKRGACALILAMVNTAGNAQAIRLGPYLQDATPTSMWVGWETTGATTSLVDYGLSASSLTQTAVGSSTASQGAARIHHTQITGLAPDTAYYYRVRTATTTSGVFRFRTPPLPSDEQPFRFVAYSDTQGGPVPDKHTEVINEGVIAFVHDNFGPNIEDELAFAIEPGDLVDSGVVYEQWKTQYFDEEQNLLQHIPMYAVPGNHEGDSHWFFDYFKLPENGTPGFLEHWWYKDHGNVRIIGCDSNGAYRIQQQLDWIDGVLAEAATNDEIDFVFAQMHHPHLSEAWTPGNTPYVSQIVAKLEAFSDATGKPTIHFFGHTHAYSRGQSRDHNHLMVNVATGEGSIDYWGLYPRADYPEYQKTFVNWGFVLMEVEAGDDPKFRLRRVSRGNQYEPRDNDVMDDITIRVNNTPPQTPTPVSPPDGTSDVPAEGATLQASAFVDADDTLHLESQFQLTTVSGDYSNPVDEWIRYENWYAPPDVTGPANGYYSVNTVTDPDITRVTLGQLAEFTPYYWRVRYRDESLGWSDWSDEYSFTTGALPKGACCLPDGACDQLTDDACAALRGAWLGLDAQCDCPPVVALLSEDFDMIPLGPNVDEPAPGQHVWSPNAPANWALDRTGMPTGGVTEWRGWSFVDPAWWVQAAGDQDRSAFIRASGVVAVADPDEWDDAAHTPGTFNSSLTTPDIVLGGVQADSVRLILDSSFRPYENQTGLIEVTFDGGATWDNLLTLDTDSIPGGQSSLERVNETLVLNIDNPSSGTMQVRFSMLNAGNDWWWAFDNLLIVGTPITGSPHTLLDEDFESIPLGPFISPSEHGGDGTDWTDVLPSGWMRDNLATPADGPPEFFGFNVLDKASWIATADDQARSTFTRGEGAVLVADPDEYDDLGDIDPDRFNVLVQTPVMNLAGARAGSVTIQFDSSFRPYDAETGLVEVSFDGGSAWDTLLTLSAATAGGASSLARADERVSLAVDNPASGTMTVRFSLRDAGNDWWWAFDNLSIRGECLADLAAPFGSIDTNDFFAFLALYQTGDAQADANDDGQINTNDFFAFLAAYQAGCRGA